MAIVQEITDIVARLEEAANGMPKLDVAGSSPVSRSIFFKILS